MSVEQCPLNKLHLKKRPYNALHRAGILCVGDFKSLTNGQVLLIKNFGEDASHHVRARISTLEDCLNFNGTIDWLKFWEQLEIELVPEDDDIADSMEVILKKLPKIISQILSYEDERQGIILKRRFGLESAQRLTLEELGMAYNLTRERVRQLEEKALELLKNVLIENIYIDKTYHVNPLYSDKIKELATFLRQHLQQPLTEGELYALLQKTFGIQLEFEPQVSVLLALLQYDEIIFRNSSLDHVWGTFTRQKIRALEKNVEQIDDALTTKLVNPTNKIDLLIEINKSRKPKERISFEQLEIFLRACSSVEILEGNQVQARFEHIRGRGNQVERILTENGEPLHNADIVRTINSRLVPLGQKPVLTRNIINQISTDDRFVPIGKSGLWGLSEWSVNTGTIIDLMKQCFMTLNRPATSEEIYKYVLEKRPVQKSSIDAYLIFQDAFAKVDREKWGLAEWNEVKDARTWTPLQVGKFVEAIFRKHRVKRIEYGVIRKALQDETDLSDRQAQGLLNVNPVILTERASDKTLWAVFQPDYLDKLSDVGAGFARKKKTMRQLVKEDVEHELENAAGHQMALNELVKMLTEKYNKRDKTFYQYISAMESVEKFTIEESNTTMCRLRRASSNTSGFPEVENILSSNLRSNVSRALTFMTIENVDVALFLISKEFEATLKSYLETGNQAGIFNNFPQGRLSLDTMVNFVARQQIITDQAVLHFLRQKRNDRAHGTMPTEGERRIMFKHAETTANMYIDYIKFFDDLEQSLP